MILMITRAAATGTKSFHKLKSAEKETAGQAIAFKVSSKMVYVVMGCVDSPKVSYLCPNSQYLSMYSETGPLKRQWC